MLTSTGKAGVPVYFNGFIHLMTAEQYVSEMETIFRDERFAGFDLYEVAAILGPNSNGTRVEELDGGFDKIMAKSQELGIG